MNHRTTPRALAILVGLTALLSLSPEAHAQRSSGVARFRGGMISFACAAGKLLGVNSSGYAACRQAGNALVAEDIGLHCDQSANDTSTIRSAIEGGTAAGKTLRLPSGCKSLLGTPGAGDSVADLMTDTVIECEDHSAGFVLATKTCSSGSDTPGAACTADNQCRNGTCQGDVTGDAFAPSSGSTYTVFGAASGAQRVAVKGCSIWANGANGIPAAVGGNDKRWGYCNGAGSSTAGQGCFSGCNVASGVLYGLPCTSDASCGAGACVDLAGSCKTNGGTCLGAIPYATPWGASGRGKIHPIDFSAGSSDAIRSVKIWDHRRGDFSVKSGNSGSIADVTNNLASAMATPPIANFPHGPKLQASVNYGIYGTYGTSIERFDVSGWDAAVYAAGRNTVLGGSGSGYGDPAESTWNGTAGIEIAGSYVRSYGFVGGPGLLNCVRPKFGLGYNFLVSSPYCDSHIGAKFIAQDAGNQYADLRGAWGSIASVMSLGDQRGRCPTGTPRANKLCIFGAGTDATIGCPSSACAAHNDFPATGVTHLEVGGTTLLHTDQANAALIRATDSKRCADGTGTIGGPCTADADCGTGGKCRFLRYSDVSIKAELYVGGTTGVTGVDLSTSSVGQAIDSPLVGGGPSIEVWDLDLSFGKLAVGVKFPTATRRCVGGASAGNTCSAHTDCTGGGSCELPVKNFVIRGNAGAVTTPLQGWDWGFGDYSGLSGLLPSDDQCKPINYVAGEALTRGQVVSASSSTDNAVVKTTTGNPERALGVALGDTISGDTVKVCSLGVAACIADEAISNGAALTPSTSTSGRVKTWSTGDVIVGRALDSPGSAGTVFDCAIGPVPPTQGSTSVFPKFDSDRLATSQGFTSSCATTQLLNAKTYTATSGKKIRLESYVPVNQTTSATRTATIYLKRGGSGCDSGSPTILAQADTALTSAQNKINASLSYTDTGQSGSVTYRVCACSNGAGTQADAGSVLNITETN
ncbi:hypothetical protein K2Z84_05355 [Candidatus Binatia bacterium]|nr:hypothetical protein [Candidatus Binatia bacterium]